MPLLFFEIQAPHAADIQSHQPLRGKGQPGQAHAHAESVQFVVQHKISACSLDKGLSLFRQPGVFFGDGGIHGILDGIQDLHAALVAVEQ